MSTSFAFKPIVTDGLILNLDAANRRSFVSGSTSWNDLSGNRNTGTLTNGPTFNSSNGGSIQFDGVDDSVNFGNNSRLSPSAITINTWFRVNNQNASNNEQTIIRNTTGGYQVLIQTNLSYLIGVYTNSITQTTYISPANTITYNKIYNITITFSNSSLRTYLNGVLVNTTSTPGSTLFYVTNTVYIGSEQNLFLNGNVYYTSLYNRALSATEVLQNYNALKNRYI